MNETPDGTQPTRPQRGVDRRRAALMIAPFIALGLADVVLLLYGGIDPLWGFVILPPIVFISAIGWIAFRTGFHDRRGRADRAE